MTNFKIISCFLFSALFSINTYSIPQECSSSDGIETCRVSIIQLIANPEKYHGKFVYVSGFYVNIFETSALFLSKHDADIFITSNAIWVKLSESLEGTCTEQKGYVWMCEELSEYEAASGKYVDIFGIFNMNNQGHLASYKGAIENVNSFSLLNEN